MSLEPERTKDVMRARLVAATVVVAILVVAVLGVRWAAQQKREPPPPRRAMQYTMVKIQPPPSRAPPPPPPRVAQPKEVEPQATRVEVKATDIPPPDSPPPASAPAAPAAGPLALAAEGEGPGDAFNLAGNPGGRALLAGGGPGDGTGSGAGGVGGGPGTRYGWYYARIAAEIEEAFRKNRRLTAASARVELRVWSDASGRITRVQLVRSTGDAQVDEAVQSVVGLRLREPPPADIPMPMVARLTARRPM